MKWLLDWHVLLALMLNLICPLPSALAVGIAVPRRRCPLPFLNKKWLAGGGSRAVLLGDSIPSSSVYEADPLSLGVSSLPSIDRLTWLAGWLATATAKKRSPRSLSVSLTPSACAAEAEGRGGESRCLLRSLPSLSLPSLKDECSSSSFCPQSDESTLPAPTAGATAAQCPCLASSASIDLPACAAQTGCACFPHDDSTQVMSRLKRDESTQNSHTNNSATDLYPAMPQITLPHPPLPDVSCHRVGQVQLLKEDRRTRGAVQNERRFWLLVLSLSAAARAR